MTPENKHAFSKIDLGEPVGNEKMGTNYCGKNVINKE